MAAGFFYNCARLQKDGSYKTVKNPTTVHIHPSSSLREALPRWVVYHELVMTSKQFMRTVTEIDPKWLVEIAPHYYSKADIQNDGKKLPKGKGKAADAA
jgi:pre-mRNA-splicing factor ATP-dependent RNA helicase DHX16